MDWASSGPAKWVKMNTRATPSSDRSRRRSAGTNQSISFKSAADMRIVPV